jgi:hypothetical protein
MKVKHLVLAVAVLGAASALTWFVRSGDDTPKLDARVGEPVLAEDVVARIRGLELHTPSGSVEVSTTDGSDTRWVVENYHSLPADFSKVHNLIKELRDAKIVQFASARPERLERMEFGENRIVLRGADDAVLRTFHLGKNYEGGGRFLKYDAEEKAYVATLNAYLDGTAKNWANTALITAKPEEVVGLEVAFPDGSSLTLKRENGTAAWTSPDLKEGETLKETEVNSLVSKLTGLRFSETADPTAEDVVAARQKENMRAMSLTLATGKTYDITMGRQPAPPAPPPPPPVEEGTTPPAPPAPKAGPVYVAVKSSDASEPINASMERRAFQIYEWTFTSLPADRAALMNPAPANAAAPAVTPPAEAPAADAPAASETEPEAAPDGGN